MAGEVCRWSCFWFSGVWFTPILPDSRVHADGLGSGRKASSGSASPQGAEGLRSLCSQGCTWRSEALGNQSDFSSSECCRDDSEAYLCKPQSSLERHGVARGECPDDAREQFVRGPAQTVCRGGWVLFWSLTFCQFGHRIDCQLQDKFHFLAY